MTRRDLHLLDILLNSLGTIEEFLDIGSLKKEMRDIQCLDQAQHCLQTEKYEGSAYVIE
jgi:hypothetical protein